MTFVDNARIATTLGFLSGGIFGWAYGNGLRDLINREPIALVILTSSLGSLVALLIAAKYT